MSSISKTYGRTYDIYTTEYYIGYLYSVSKSFRHYSQKNLVSDMSNFEEIAKAEFKDSILNINIIINLT